MRTDTKFSNQDDETVRLLATMQDAVRQCFERKRRLGQRPVVWDWERDRPVTLDAVALQALARTPVKGIQP